MSRNDDTRDFKLAFRKGFNTGDLYRNWHQVYDGDTYLSKWASHRMQVALRRIDAYGLGRIGRALDIGIGSGALIKELSNRGCEAWGSDVAIQMLQDCRKALDPAHESLQNRFMVTDVETLPLKNDSFDLVTCLGVLEYLPNEEKAIEELYRIVRPGGYSLIGVASYYRVSKIISAIKRRLFHESAMKTDGRVTPSTPDHRMFSPLDLRKKFADAGFIVKKFESFGAGLFDTYVPLRLSVPGLIYIGDHCLALLKKPD